jgi:Spy/CpxP family protein refolding chaperone
MKTLKYLAFTAAVALAIGGLFALNSRAAQSASADGALAGKLRERVKQKLNLSEDQLAKIKSEFKAEKSNLTGILTRLHDAHAQLRTEIHKADATETSVRDAAAKVSAVEADLAVERLKLYGKISPILTADQRAKLVEFEAGIDQFIERVINRIDSKLSE